VVNGMDRIKFTFSPTDKTTIFDFKFDIQSLKNKIKEVIQNINEPFIFNTATLDNYFFNVRYSDFYSLHHAIHDILSVKTGLNNIYDIAAITCIKDEEWTKERNKDYTYEVYIKYTLKSEYVNLIINYCNNWIKELESIYTNVAMKIEAEKKAREERQAQFKIEKVYQQVMPKGGEDGEDGYFDADITNGEQTIRFVARNVFDFGFYTYPKRLEGTEDIFNREIWTEIEHNISNWLYEFSPFTTNVRM
jgi:membrane-associated HD superfamily phosphohydrolase